MLETSKKSENATNATKKAPSKRTPKKVLAAGAAPTTVKAASAKRAAVKKVSAKKVAPVRQLDAEPEAVPVKKVPVKKAPAKKAPAKKAVKGVAAKAAPAKKVAPVRQLDAEPEAVPAKRSPAKRSPAKKAPAKKAVKGVAAKAAPATKAAPKKTAAKKAAPAPVMFSSVEATTAAATDSGVARRSTRSQRTAAKSNPTVTGQKLSAVAIDALAPKTVTGAIPPPQVLFQTPSEVPPARRRVRSRAASAPGGATGTDQTGPAVEPAAATADITVAEAAEDATAEPEDVREAAAEEATGARRRRRRGRRGRGGSTSVDSEESALLATPTPDTEPSIAVADLVEDEDGEGTGTRRRRRRRRSVSDTAGVKPEDDPPNTVVHVRQTKATEDDGVRGVRGSTRLEAKRQRRKDGRDSGRRRPSILTESEFLARRESVDRVMAVRQNGDRTQIAVLEDSVLVEHYVTRASATSYVGNIYLGRVQNVLPSMEAAFIDISKGRNGVIYAGEVNWDGAGLAGKSRAIEQAMKSGDAILVQVTKDPIGHKGARLTSQISLPGRYLVYVPGGGMTGISRKLPDTERHRLKAILRKIVPEDAGVIIRTAAEGATEEELTHDVERLKAQWEIISKKAAKTAAAPTLVHGEPDLAIRVVRDVFNEDFKQLIVQGAEVATTITDYLSDVAPELAERVSMHSADQDLFSVLRVDEQLMKALDNKVWLPSGGSLVIDRTEAMTVIDVNTGKFVGAGGNLEQTVTRNNLEAAEEIVRQLRLRDVGGIVVIDFIDMVLESNRDLVLRRLTECLGRDRTKHQVAEVTSLGLVQMTRKRVGEGLLAAFSEPCEHCHGRGVLVQAEPVDIPVGAALESAVAAEGEPKSRRRRGAKRSEPVPDSDPDPVMTPEQRQVALVAMSAVHRAAKLENEVPDTGTKQEESVATLTEIPTVVPVEILTESAVAADQEEPNSRSQHGSIPRRRRRTASRPAGPPAESVSS